MLRNIPNNYTRQMMLDLLDEVGLAERHNFVYMPMDFKSSAGLGYAFVNLVSHEDAVKAMEVCFLATFSVAEDNENREGNN